MRRSNPSELTDENIHEYLVSGVPLEHYALSTSFGNIGPIYSYTAENGRMWVDTIEDDGLYEACINYLLRYGAPILETKEAVEEHTRKLREKYKDLLKLKV
jgi:hypothetical protein